MFHREPKYILKLSLKCLLIRISLRHAKAYSESRQKSKMELFVEIVKDFKPLTIFSENSILDVLLGSENASGMFS